MKMKILLLFTLIVLSFLFLCHLSTHSAGDVPWPQVRRAFLLLNICLAFTFIMMALLPVVRKHYCTKFFLYAFVHYGYNSLDSYFKCDSLAKK